MMGRKLPVVDVCISRGDFAEVEDKFDDDDERCCCCARLRSVFDDAVSASVEREGEGDRTVIPDEGKGCPAVKLLNSRVDDVNGADKEDPVDKFDVVAAVAVVAAPGFIIMKPFPLKFAVSAGGDGRPSNANPNGFGISDKDMGGATAAATPPCGCSTALFDPCPPRTLSKSLSMMAQTSMPSIKLVDMM
jgi:hypothetical protein